MSLLNTILHKILPKLIPSEALAPSTNMSAAPSTIPTSVPDARPGNAGSAPVNASATPGGSSADGHLNVSAPKAEIDVEEILRGLEKKNPQALDWRHSIVDLMKLVGMESDLASRKQLARELSYTGNFDDTAKMNMWLHQQVMLKIEQNGGKIPAAMKH